MSSETIQRTVQLWQAEPSQAYVTPMVTVSSEGTQGMVQTGPFTWHCDLPASLGGTNTAPSPGAFLLSALAGCAVVFIRDTIAPQLGVRVESVTATVQCEADYRGLLGMDGVAPDYQNLTLTVRIQSPDPEAQVQQVYDVWQQRCPIYLALLKGLPIQTNLEIVGQVG